MPKTRRDQRTRRTFVLEAESGGQHGIGQGVGACGDLAWNDLMTGRQLLSARVEYESKQGIPTDFLSVWTVMSWGYQDRVCDYWTSGSPAHPAGVGFSNSYHSDALARALDFIMKNQDQFTRPVDAWRPHLVLIQPPTADQAAEAGAWMTGIEAPVKRAGGTEGKGRNGGQALEAAPTARCLIHKLQQLPPKVWPKSRSPWTTGPVSQTDPSAARYNTQYLRKV